MINYVFFKKNRWGFLTLNKEEVKMPRRDKTGPRSGSKGPRDGRGQGRGRASGKGTGRKTGGKKGNC
jgi:hypothetical protein